MVGFPDAARYWLGRKSNELPDSAEHRVLQYLSQVYDSGIPWPWVNRTLAVLGVGGCLTAIVLEVNGLCTLYFTSFISQPLVDWLAGIMLVGLSLPFGILVFGKWRKPVEQRRLGAFHRIFGDFSQATAVADDLRIQYPNASDKPTFWAFPIHPDYIAMEAGKSFLYAYWALVLSSMYVAHTKSRFVETLIFALALFFVPVVLNGVLAAFDGWNQKRERLMTYPVSVFLRDIRIVDTERKYARRHEELSNRHKELSRH